MHFYWHTLYTLNAANFHLPISLIRSFDKPHPADVAATILRLWDE